MCVCVIVVAAVVGLRAHLEQHAGEVVVGELEVALVVELEQGRTVRVVVLEVQVVHLGLVGRVAALLAHVDLVESKRERHKPTNQTFVEDSLVLFRVVCVSGFHTCDSC